MTPDPHQPGHTVATDEVTIEERRARIAPLLLQHLTYRQIAVEVGCSHETVRTDRLAILAEWKAQSADTYAEMVAEEDAKYDAVEAKLMARVMGGDTARAAVEPLISLFERRAKLHGLDKPVKIHAKLDPEGESAMDTEIRRLADSFTGPMPETTLDDGAASPNGA
jgi:uncharacterized protein YerC